MRINLRFVGLLAVLLTLSASAHLCNNIYRTPDRVIVKPEKQSVVLDGTDEFRVFVQNNYHTYLHNLRLAAQVQGGGVTVKISPASVSELIAGQRVAFTVHLTAGAGAAGRRALQFGVSANEIGFRQLQEPTNEELMKSASDGNHSPAVMAAESLVVRGDARGMQKLQSFASRDNPDYRGRAIRAIGKAGNKQAIPFLRNLLNERNGWVQGNALLALGLLGDVQDTFSPYWRNRDEFVRAAAVAGVALASDEPPKWTEQWLPAGLKSQNVYVRIACGWALAAQRNKDGIDILDTAFRTNDPQQRTTAGDALVDVANRAQ